MQLNIQHPRIGDDLKGPINIQALVTEDSSSVASDAFKKLHK